MLFGPFRLQPRQRLLTEAGKPVRLGSRAFDILIVLVERAGELVSKEELMARVWPATFVGVANLAVHISALRRALRDRRRGDARYVMNISGRGYRFVAPVRRVEEAQASAPAIVPQGDYEILPPRGRSGQVAEEVQQSRLLAFVGSGEAGRTEVALALVQQLIGTDCNGVRLVDLASVEDANGMRRLIERAARLHDDLSS
jgi:DNA-binding winged helix-turn-helix (wHTH) protein